MIKILILTLFAFGLLNCSTTDKSPAYRCPAGQGVSCAAFTSSSKALIPELVAELDAYQKNVNAAKSIRERNAVVSAELKKHLKEGTDKFLNADHQLIFKDQMREAIDASGTRRAAVFTVTHKGKKYFIKQLKTERSIENVVQEVQNAKLLSALGLSPKTELVTANNIPYLVMEHVSSINIKEVVVPESRTDGTRQRIDDILNYQSQSVDEGARTFARVLLYHPGYHQRLFEIAHILETYNFTDTSDFQFMVDLNKGPDSIQIIDVKDFRRNTNVSADFPSPDVSVRVFWSWIQRTAR